MFILLSLLPMIITGFYSYILSSRAIQHKINTYSLQVVNQVARNIAVEMLRLENDAIDVGFSATVQDILINYGSISDWQVANAQETIRDMLVKKFTFLHDVSDVLLYTGDNRIVNAYGDKGFKLRFRSDYQRNLLGEIKRRNGAPVWAATGRQNEIHLVSRIWKYENGLIVGRAIRSLYEGEYIGAVLIRINERFFSAIYQNVDIGQGAEVFVMDAKGVIVSSRTTDLPFMERYKEGSLGGHLQENERQGHDVFSFYIDGAPHLIAFSRLENAGWYIVSTIPYSYLNLESGRIRNGIIFLGISCFLLAVILSVFFTRSISGPMSNLIHAMHEVKKGNLSIHITDTNRDEIAELTHSFNTMVKDIEKLMTDLKNKEIQKKDAEYKALQAQINPHFLSNVLNTAKLLANAQKAENLESLLTSLIQLLHVSMGKEGDLITVRKEIQYLQAYLNIEEFRYYDKFQVHFEIEEEILENKLPKFLFQPILENAIIHGIGPKKGRGVIEVKGFAYEGKMFFIIRDDGIGMRKETIESILEEDLVTENHFCGIGIKNVQERIKLSFGCEYGLCIDSHPNHFTTVEVTLPIIR